MITLTILIEIVRCPNCGASFKPTDERKQQCPYCDAWLIIEQKEKKKDDVIIPVPQTPRPYPQPKTPEPKTSPWKTSDGTAPDEWSKTSVKYVKKWENKDMAPRWASDFTDWAVGMYEKIRKSSASEDEKWKPLYKAVVVEEEQ